MQFQFWTHHDHGTTGIVNTLAEKVLTETTMLTFEHVGQRLQRTFVGTGDHTTTTTVIKQSVYRFLQHALFVPDDDIRGTQFHQALQTVVTVDYTAIQIVQIRCCETTTIQWHQWAQIGWYHRHNGHDHPFWAVARFNECFNDLQTLGQLDWLQGRGAFGDFLTKFLGDLFQIQRCQNFTNSFGANHGCEAVFTILILSNHIFFFSKKLILFQRRQARLDHDIILKIENALKILERHVQQLTDTAWQRLQEPDVSNRSSQLDMPHAFTANTGQSDFNTTFFTNDAFIFHALIFAAQALIVLDRAKNTRTEQTITLRLERTIIDGFRLLDFTK